ncbi:hypothetical protein PBI_TRISCUIT_6 [Microbacterium phage Triscuit]|nr:hypothetical protein PBI_TRISCUIT_111 [Microbacterium phage Triscuit]AVR56983.1 hypothetical protein PBI_TRISCUIT_6 [Microbacterium phage Triscuit]
MPLYDLTFDIDPDVYTIDLPAPLDALDDEYALHLMRTSLTTVSEQVAKDAARTVVDDFSDDDTDYFPARAGVQMQLISALTQLDDIGHGEILRRLLNDHDFVTDLLTADIRLALHIEYKD